MTLTELIAYLQKFGFSSFSLQLLEENQIRIKIDDQEAQGDEPISLIAKLLDQHQASFDEKLDRIAGYQIKLEAQKAAVVAAKNS